MFVLKVPFGQQLFAWLGAVVTRILGFSYAGSSFVFGKIGAPMGGDSNIGVVFAFQILPAIIFVSALFAILYYLGVMQVVVRAMAVVMNKLLHASGAESLNVAASIFMGQTEAPLTIRPFLNKMTRSELMTVMTAGMAHVSGSIMAAYIAFGIEARHLLTAVIMTAPGTILMAKLLEPETETPETMGEVKLDIPKTDVNVVDAASRGTGEGLHLMLNVIAMLISFIAIVALLNGLFGWVHGFAAWFPASLQTVLGWIGRPDRVGDGRPVARQRHHRRAARRARGAERVHRLRGPRADAGRRSTRARSPSRRSRCAASPTSARWASRSAASARWRRSASTTSRGSASARCWRGRWPTSCRRRSRGYLSRSR